MKMHLRQYVAIGVSAAILIVVAVFVKSAMEAKKAQVRRPPPTAQVRPYVSVQVVQTGSYQPTLSAYGTAESKFSLELGASVSGKIVSINSQFEAGKLVQQGQVLAQIDDIDYEAEVANNRYLVAEAELALQEEQRTAQQAQAEWDASGIKNVAASDLLLRKPYLAAAQAALQDAETSLQQAQQALADTRIKAPFNALVVDRLVVPGSYVQTGTSVATLYSTDRVDVQVSISVEDWQKLVDIGLMTAQRWPVTLADVETKAQWQGYVEGAQSHRDSETRMRVLTVSVDLPFEQTPKLLPGSFLEASILGKEIEGLWELPSTALSQKSEIWIVNAENVLQPFSAESVFSNGDKIYIRPPENLADSEQMVVIQPYSSYLQGMNVKPQTADGLALFEETAGKGARGAEKGERLQGPPKNGQASGPPSSGPSNAGGE